MSWLAHRRLGTVLLVLTVLVVASVISFSLISSLVVHWE